MNSNRNLWLSGLCAALGMSISGSVFAQANQPQPVSPNGTQAAGGANEAGGVSNPASPKPAASGAAGAANAASPNDPAANLDARSSANPYQYNGINQSPWFSNPMVRRELNLDHARYQQLNDGYGQAWNNYNQQLSRLNPNGAPSRWSDQQQELSNAFHKELDQHTINAFNDPNALDRYNQLYMQYRGYSAFNEPTVRERLDLTPAQLQKFNDYNRDWNTRMARWNTEYPGNPKMVESAYNSYQRSVQQNLDATLNPQQRSEWSTMTGRPFNFTPDYYFQRNPAVNVNVGTAAEQNVGAGTQQNPTAPQQ